MGTRKTKVDGGSATWGLVALPIVAAGILTMVLGHPVYGTNDDWSLATLISGGYSGQRETAVPFMGPLSVGVLHLAYAGTTSLPWYGIWIGGLGTLGVIALAVGSVAGRRTPPFLPLLVTATILGVAFEVWFIMVPTFTTAACILVAGGMLMLAAALPTADLPARKGCAVFAGTLIGVGVTLRSDVAVAALLVPVPYVFAAALRALRRGEYRALLVVALGAALPCAALSITSLALGPALRQDVAWPRFAEANALRGTMHSTARGPLLPTVYKELGWSLARLELFGMSSQPDVTALAPHELRRAVDATAAGGGLTSTLRAKPADVVSATIWPALKDVAALAAIASLLGLAALGCCAGAGWPRGPTTTFVCQLLWAVLLLYGIAAALRLPERFLAPVLVSLSAVWIAVLAGVVAETRAPTTRLISRYALFGVATIVSTGFFLTSGPVARTQRAEIATTYRSAQLSDLGRRHQDITIIAAAGYLTGEAQTPFKRLDVREERLRSVDLGWPTESPGWRRRVIRLGLAPDALLPAIASDPNVAWLSNAQIASSLNSYLHEQGLLEGDELCEFEPFLWRPCRPKATA
jgi:hypothetical protein